MSSEWLDNPIIFIGTQRSGTTWMGRVFSGHPDLAYWSEPRHIWTLGNSYKPNDLLTADDASPIICNRIRKRFRRYVEDAQKLRLVEKTPSNCLRIPFLHAVYPNAKIILVVRDGRSVFRSTNEIMKKNVPVSRIAQRAFETPFTEWPAYVPRAFSTLSRKLTGRRLNFWGPRPEGWHDWLKHDPPNVVLAKQWSATITRAVEDGSKLDSDHFFQFKYEDMMASPSELMSRIVDFAQLPNASKLIQRVKEDADPTRQDKWKSELDNATLEEIRPFMEPTLNALGYTW